MKKLFGLMVAGSICMFSACSSDDDGVNVPQQAQSNCAAFGYVDVIDPATGLVTCGLPAASSAGALVGVSSSSVDASIPGMTQVVGSSSSAPAMAQVSSSSVAAVVDAASSSSAPAAATPASSAATTTPTVTPVVEEEDDGLFKIGLWDGSTGGNQVPTGNKAGGYWYSYTDSGNKGASTLEWSAEAAVGSDYAADDLSPIIKECGGLCGKFNLVAGSNTECAPYVAVAFNYAKSDKTIADATASKGVCITYKSTMPIEVDLGMGSKDATYGYNNPAYILPKTASLSTVDISWSEFEQQWEGDKAITGPAAAAILAAIKLQVKGSEVGEDEGEGTFLITKFGAYGQCD